MNHTKFSIFNSLKFAIVFVTLIGYFIFGSALVIEIGKLFIYNVPIDNLFTFSCVSPEQVSVVQKGEDFHIFYKFLNSKNEIISENIVVYKPLFTKEIPDNKIIICYNVLFPNANYINGLSLHIRQINIGLFMYSAILIFVFLCSKAAMKNLRK